MRFAEKVAIVTGAAGVGIGQATAKAFAREGASVVVSDAHVKRPFDVAQEISSSLGVKALGVQCDVSNQGQVEAMIKQTLNEFGRIDVLVNNAGIDRYSSVVDMTDETWDLIINVNLKGAFYCTRAVLPTMIKQKGGRIVNLTSPVAWWGGENDAAYCAAKAGVAALTKSVAKEVARYNILVNAIAPSAWNPFLARNVPEEVLKKSESETPLGRLGRPEEIARVIVFLASEDAGFMTGDTLSVTGGYFMH